MMNACSILIGGGGGEEKGEVVSLYSFVVCGGVTLGGRAKTENVFCICIGTYDGSGCEVLKKFEVDYLSCYPAYFV